MSAGKVTWATAFAAAVILGQGAADSQQSNELEAVTAAHEAFHAAVSKEDIDLMSDTWLHDPSVRLIVPPGKQVFAGWDEVKGSFEGAFEALDVISLTMKDVQTVIGEEFAWIVEVHELEMRTAEGEIIKPNYFSTKIFRKVEDRWLMVHHQASAPPVSDE